MSVYWNQQHVQLSGATPNTYSVQFCKFEEYFYTRQQQQPCFEVSTITVDASGSAQQSFHFPRPGTWSGQFEFLAPGADYLHPTYSTVVPETESLGLATAANAGEWKPIPQDPLQSGTIFTDGSNITVTLNGAAPNATYNVYECGTDGEGNCYQEEWAVTTDATGSAKVTGPVLGVPFRKHDFLVTRGSGGGQVEFVSGFIAP